MRRGEGVPVWPLAGLLDDMGLLGWDRAPLLPRSRPEGPPRLLLNCKAAFSLHVHPAHG